MKERDAEIVVLLNQRGDVHKLEEEIETKLQFCFMDSVTTNPIQAKFASSSISSSIASPIVQEVKYCLKIPEDYTQGMYSFTNFESMMKGAQVFQGDRCIGYVSHVRLYPYESNYFEYKARELQEINQQEKEKCQKLLQDQLRLNRIIPIIGIADVALFFFTLWRHSWKFIPLQIAIGIVLWVVSDIGKATERRLEDKIKAFQANRYMN